MDKTKQLYSGLPWHFVLNLELNIYILLNKSGALGYCIFLFLIKLTYHGTILVKYYYTKIYCYFAYARSHKQEEKRAMVSSAFGEDKSGGHATRLTVEDLRYLFGI